MLFHAPPFLHPCTSVLGQQLKSCSSSAGVEAESEKAGGWLKFTSQLHNLNLAFLILQLGVISLPHRAGKRLYEIVRIKCQASGECTHTAEMLGKMFSVQERVHMITMSSRYTSGTHGNQHLQDLHPFHWGLARAQAQLTSSYSFLPTRKLGRAGGGIACQGTIGP